MKRPVSSQSHTSNVGRVGKRARQLLNEVSLHYLQLSTVFTLPHGQVPFAVHPKATAEDSEDQDTVPNAITPTPPPAAPVPSATSPSIPPAVLVLDMVPRPAPLTTPPPTPTQPTVPPPPPPRPQSHSSTAGNVWLPATNLVTGGDGRLQHSRQSPELNKYLSKTIRSISLKVFFIDAFPSLEKQNEWLGQSLVAVLQDQAKTDQVACEVNMRAQQDGRYMSGLLSMVCCIIF